MNYKSVLVITYGRSGSTLLQGLLNAISGVVVRGENHNMFYDLYCADRKIGKMPRNPSNSMPSDPWFGSHFYQHDYYRNMVRTFARETLLAGVKDRENIRCFGFKEIRYVHHQEDFLDYLAFLKTIFPAPALIFNTRNLDQVCKSGWWASENEEDVREKLLSLEAKFDAYLGAHSDAFKITYDDVISANQNLENLYRFLGAEYDIGVIKQVLAQPHSYGATQEHVRNLFDAPTA
ncbi:MAG: sulfotransferase [Pseudomonadales bacterium]